jgi:AraC-like DNA-binding protein
MDGFLRTIILLGAIQGIITGFLLFYSTNNRRSGRLLALLLWLMSLAGLNLYLEYTGWFYSSTPIAVAHALVPMVIIMPIGPLIFFYIRSCLDPNFSLGRRHRIHFLPAIIDVVPQLAALVFITGVLMRWLIPNQEPWGIFIDTYNTYADIPRWLSLTAYLLLSVKFISTWKNKHGNLKDPFLVAKMKWLQLFVRLFMIFQLIWLVYLIPYSIPRYNSWILSTFDWYPIYIPIAILIYWLGIKGYMLGLTISPVDKSRKGQAGFSQQIIQGALDQLIKAMEKDKLYLNPSLAINDLARHGGLSVKLVSLVLNQHMNMSFNEYVNRYRVEEFKKKMLAGASEHLTMSAIAFECGFNSQASFQRIFKQQTGMPPSEFRKSLSETP